MTPVCFRVMKPQLCKNTRHAPAKQIDNTNIFAERLLPLKALDPEIECFSCLSRFPVTSQTAEVDY
jgi:hypothetical protein